MRFSTIQLLGLIGVQAVFGHPSPAAKGAYSIAKRNGPGIDGELYLNEITIGDKIGEGVEGKVYKATVNANGWDKTTTWALKKDYKNLKNVDKEFAAFSAINGEGIGPGFGAKVSNDDLDEIGLLMEYIETRKTDENSKDDARGALTALKKMHDLGWVHGDMSAIGNFLIRKSDGKAYLVDFTAASQTKDSKKKSEDIDMLKLAFSGVEFDGDNVKD
ncbi:hypothetical protein BJ170DRAFT_597424 [Xylariales sp. AK1849]|nr:hypothetical protein BJ170DRAFT_597424 [Xylariales sp. AK1849]